MPGESKMWEDIYDEKEVIEDDEKISQSLSEYC